jgi:nucleotide-binding universal stress UspA family protein
MAGLIVVGVDGSETGRAGLRFALPEARLRGARLRVVNAWEVPPLAATGTGFVPVYDLLSTDVSVAAERVIDSDLERVGGAGDVDVERLGVQGGAAHVLVEQAREAADLLVVGSRGRGGFASLLLGSVGQRCAATAPGVTVVVPPAERRAAAGG